MKIHDRLANVAMLIASRRQAAHSKNRDEEKLWLYLRALSNFVGVTGQVYRFEDFLARTPLTEIAHASARSSAQQGALVSQTVQLLRGALEETHESEQKQSLFVLVALLDFLAATGQLTAAEDFFVHLTAYAPVAIARFSSRAEAEAWLNGAAEPPSPALILIGDEYHQFWHMREDGTRGMYRDYPIEPTLEALTARGLPSQTPSFATRTAAEEWLTAHPASPYAFLTIAGEYCFAVHHRLLERHSIHPVASTLEAWEERKRAVELEAELERGPVKPRGPA